MKQRKESGVSRSMKIPAWARHWADQLQAKGVGLIDHKNAVFECMACGRRWRSTYPLHGRMHNGHWKCPFHRCNHNLPGHLSNPLSLPRYKNSGGFK
jgi:hypothetical protein